MISIIHHHHYHGIILNSGDLVVPKIEDSTEKVTQKLEVNKYNLKECKKGPKLMFNVKLDDKNNLLSLLKYFLEKIQTNSADNIDKKLLEQ